MWITAVSVGYSVHYNQNQVRAGPGLSTVCEATQNRINALPRRPLGVKSRVRSTASYETWGGHTSHHSMRVSRAARYGYPESS